MKNLKNIKTNNEDYFIMQNIVTGNGLNTTKNKKVEKSFDNLVTAFNKGSLNSGQRGNSSNFQQTKQNNSQESSIANMSKYHTRASGKTQKLSKSGGKKKTLSISPKRAHDNQAKSHRGTTGGHQSITIQSQNKKMRENTQDLNQFIKTLEKFSKNSNLELGS